MKTKDQKHFPFGDRGSSGGEQRVSNGSDVYAHRGYSRTCIYDILNQDPPLLPNQRRGEKKKAQ